MKKLRVGVIYGGRSSEHEVSLASAAAVFKHLDRARYEPVPIRIEKDGRWSLPDAPPLLESAAEVIQTRADARPALRETHFVARPGSDTLLSIDRTKTASTVSAMTLDVVFPVLHGPYGEDGTVQGLLELAGVPYVGAGVLASAVGMDKATMKLVFAARGLPICDYEVVRKYDWKKNRHAVLTSVVDRLGFPVFVKPANLGSSVGWQLRHSGLSTWQGWRESISCCPPKPTRCTSTSSTPFPGSPRSACTRRCGQRRGSTTRRCSIA